MSSKITIIGAGSVGSTIAYTLSNEDIASEIVLIDINKKKVEGEVMDIAQGTCFRDPVSIIAGEYEDAKDSDIVIITSGIARKPGQTRIELTQTNVNILKSITPEIVKAAPNAIYIIVSNPVDIMTYVFTKISGLPENQILGSGTMLDSARLRCGLSEHLNIAQKNIHAYVFGEHGDTSFIPWSGAYVSGVSLDEYYETVEKMGKNVTKIDKDAMLEYVRTSGGQVIANKVNNFETHLASPQSELAAQTMKDPYVFDFIPFKEDMMERDIEQALVKDVTKLLLELGTGFAFLGNQYHLNVGGDDFYIDLLFYNLNLRCYVVIELKTGEFKPEYAGQLNFYLSAVDGILKKENDHPSIGLLLCKSKNDLVAEYALKDMSKPMGISAYKVTSSLPEELQRQLPSIEDIEKRIQRE